MKPVEIDETPDNITKFITDAFLAFLCYNEIKMCNFKDDFLHFYMFLFQNS